MRARVRHRCPLQAPPAFQRADRHPPQRTAANAQFLRKKLFPRLLAGLVPAAEDALFQLLNDVIGQDLAFVCSQGNFN